MYRDLSPGAFFDMKENDNEPVGLGEVPKMGMAMMGKGPVPMGPTGDGLQGYEHFDMQTLNAMSRQQKELQENYALLATIQDDKKKKNERQSIRKYFYLRDIYANHLPYEVGYMTHIIMIKYQNMLELYQYASKLIGQGKDLKINRLQMTHFHKSVTQDSRTIVHMCNMMHELKNKYESRPYDPGNRFDAPANYSQIVAAQDNSNENDADEDTRLRQRAKLEPERLDKEYVKKRLEQSHKIINEALAKRKKKLQQARQFYDKNGYVSTTRTQQPMRLWSPKLDYGWSGEDW